MGYRESLIPITYPAEAAGIRDAIEVFRRVHTCNICFCCVTRGIVSQRQHDDKDLADTVALFVVIAGEEEPYQGFYGTDALKMYPVDALIGPDSTYTERFCDLPYEVVLDDIPQHLGEMASMQAHMIEYLREADAAMQRQQGIEVRILKPGSQSSHLTPHERVASHYSSLYVSPLGVLTLVGDGTHLCGLRLQDEDASTFGHTIASSNSLYLDDSVEPFHIAKQWLDAYFIGDRPSLTDIPLRLDGDVVRKAIWKEIACVAYGTTASFGEIAHEVTRRLGGKRVVPRAVVGAIQHNPLPIFIPTHRIIKSTGACTGYPGSSWDQVWLLSHEGIRGDLLKLPEGLEVPNYYHYEFNKESFEVMLSVVRGGIDLVA